jgi:hypothetical protein
METKKEKPDLFDQLRKIWRALKLIFFDPFYEIWIGTKTKALPTFGCWTAGIVLGLTFTFYLDHWFLSLFGKRSIHPGWFRDVLGITSVFWGFLFWGYYRVGLKARRIQKLDRTFFNAHLETRLKERPLFLSDIPIDDFTRKMRLRGRGIPLASYSSARAAIEDSLNVYIAKIENPDGNKEIVDIVYSISRPPDFWSLDSVVGYRNFTFPIGKSIRGEIVANLRVIPHYLFAGESGGGKSSHIRTSVTVLLANNVDLDVYFFDFKDGMENQVFQGFDNVTLIDDVQDASQKASYINSILDSRMRDFKAAGARSIEAYNQMRERKGNKEKRIIVVVDEISELMPTIGGKQNSALNEINAVIARIARMGRAVGMTLMIGTQKPDAKNLDPTIKANLMGIVCFPVTHFTQSTIILGNGRAAELNREIPGRAIWKNGSTQVEVQTPFLTEVEVTHAREKLSKLWARGAKEEARDVTPIEPAESSSAQRDSLS